jgi:hypothetical protein
MEAGLDKLNWLQAGSFVNEILASQGIECHVYTGEFNLGVSSVSGIEELSIDNKLKRLQQEDKEIRVLIEKCKTKN